jgi:hypothetical protein
MKMTPGGGLKAIKRSKSTWKGREKVAARYMRAAFNKMGNEGLLTSAHNLGHVQRVAIYAKEYVRVMGGGREERARAKIAGLAHDRIRDAGDSLRQKEQKQLTHEARGADYMQPLFDKRYGKKHSKAIFEAMAKHGEQPKLNEIGANLARDAVFFADKLFEANGAYIAFRRSMFMGERKDWRKVAMERGVRDNPQALQALAIESTLAESTKRIDAFSNLDKYPEHLRRFVRYQVEWQHRLVDGLTKGDKGTINLVTILFAEGLKEKPRDLGEMIRSYKPIDKSDAAFKQEAMDYLNGKLVEKFRKLVKRPA